MREGLQTLRLVARTAHDGYHDLTAGANAAMWGPAR